MKKKSLLIKYTQSQYQKLSDSRGQKRWEDFIIEYACSRKIQIVKKIPWLEFNYSTVEIVNNPTFKIVLNYLFRVNIIYVHWGLPKSGGVLKNFFRKIRLAIVLKVAKVILVNDEVSLLEAIELTSPLKVHKFKYPIDIEYYENSPNLNNKINCYYICLGNSYRDEILVKKIGSMGLNIYRLTQNENVKRVYSEINCPVKLVFNAKEDEVLNYIKNSEAVIMPLSGNESASGQHVILEALALKKKLLISRNRISNEFKKSYLIHEVEGSDPMHWIAKINGLKLKDDLEITTSETYDLRLHSQDNFNKFLDDIFRTLK